MADADLPLYEIPVPDKVAIQDAYAASETHDEYRAKVDAILGKYFSDQEVPKYILGTRWKNRLMHAAYDPDVYLFQKRKQR
eukprot:jgi/Chrzof1/15069/Cz09g26030.t1